VTLARRLAINTLQLQRPTGQAAQARGLAFAFFQFVHMLVSQPASSGAAL
jgi:hypothetical protein